ncbi:MAG TPA: hypothetical protein ENO28_09470 [Bacteroidetes bacterium]|nr:hypothetical protein [Bacteroidota bacterium]
MNALIKYISLLVLSGLILLFCIHLSGTVKSPAIIKAPASAAPAPAVTAPAYFSPAQIIEFIAPALKF